MSDSNCNESPEIQAAAVAKAIEDHHGRSKLVGAAPTIPAWLRPLVKPFLQVALPALIAAAKASAIPAPAKLLVVEGLTAVLDHLDELAPAAVAPAG